MTAFETLIFEKKRLLQDYLDCLKQYQSRFSTEESASPEQKLDLVDELTSERESRFRMLQTLDQRINEEKLQLNPGQLDQIRVQPDFQTALEQILDLAREIQLTDQSLFLYISNIGFEIRTRILRGLKEKEAISKFKSQGQNLSGDGFDQKV